MTNVGIKHASPKVARTPQNHEKSEGNNNVIRNRDMTPLSSVFDKSKATSINLACCHSLPPTKKCSSDKFNTDASPTTTKCSKNESIAKQIEDIREAFDPGNEVLDEGEGKKQQKYDCIINNHTKIGHLPTEPTTDEPTKPSTYGTGLNPPTFQLMGQPVMGKDRSKHRKENKNK
jgi:hypothetical protein